MEFIKTLSSPLFFIIVLFSAAFLMICRKGKDSMVKWLFGIAFGSLVLLSFPPFANVLMWGLEQRYPPIVNVADIEKPQYIVVLADWDSNDPTVPYTSNIGYVSALRVLEAHRIYRDLLHCKIIVSGSRDSCDQMRKLFILLGVPTDELISEDESQNTWESSVNVEKFVSGSRFILVTSAIHLPRAMLCFLYHGLRPIPAPADFRTGYHRIRKIQFEKSIIDYLPSVNSLNDSDLAIHEYLGICWYQIKVWSKL
jgi:uncharacterized SAM-binding protein YcdF (DUF218 family)